MSEHRLDEILIERPRGGMRMSSRRLPGVKKQMTRLTREAAEDGLLSPYRIKVRNKTKHLSDHLGPMRRLLRSHVGQPWNEVYGKICREVKGHTMVGQHALDHLTGYVCTAVEIVDNVPYAKGGGVWHSRFIVLGRWHPDFYVHPETGLLCLADYKRRPKPALPAGDRIVVSDFVQYRLIQDIWYEITFAKLGQERSAAVHRQYDVLLGQEIDPQLAQQAYGQLLYAKRKRQCGKKTLKTIRQILK